MKNMRNAETEEMEVRKTKVDLSFKFCTVLVLSLSTFFLQLVRIVETQQIEIIKKILSLLNCFLMIIYLKI